MRILIVDDSAVMRELVMRALRQTGHDGHDFIEASNGREALEILATDSADLILCDWKMPEMTGIETLHQLRKQGSKSPFCFVTPEATVEMRIEARECGAFAFLTKPFAPSDFDEILRNLRG